jgi:2-dehydro-3-deoxygluconokinase
VDVLVGNEEDMQLSLGIEGPEVNQGSALDAGVFVQMIDRLKERHPNVRVVATTLREVLSASRHRWSAVAAVDGTIHQAPILELDVVDRVGGGDGFASGFFFGLLQGLPIDEALRLGWAHGALLTTFPGDTTMATLDQVMSLAAGQSSRIQR